MKVCAGWHDSPHMVCPSCGIPGETGQLVCRECYPKYLALMEELRV
jgi:NMD protein affecting ribosome stability and mRNA decay